MTCRNLDKTETYRTIYLDAEVLYFEVEARAQGHRDKLTRKRDKKIATDEALHKAVVEFILARLNIGNDPLLWPDFSIQNAPTVSTDERLNAPVQETTNVSELLAVDTTGCTLTNNAGPLERMCTFNKLSSDVYVNMEINKPRNLNLEGIEHTKTAPTTIDSMSPEEEKIKDPSLPVGGTSAVSVATNGTQLESADCTTTAASNSNSHTPAVTTRTNNTATGNKTAPLMDSSHRKQGSQKIGAAVVTNKSSGAASSTVKPAAAGRSTIVNKAARTPAATPANMAAATSKISDKTGGAVVPGAVDVATTSLSLLSAAAEVTTDTAAGTAGTAADDEVPSSAEKDKKKATAGAGGKGCGTVKNNKVVPM